ncbi:GntR family transcriptional regulator [Paradesulfitobacterium ferrireducens]|uniref:GntR family transcriptional regulator n=1 Tax=Paradesulfitobacterium ferrireducens TaxID=2816476 RepID=UPI001A8E0DD8|nr:GntR family transcriptional regulator [Paradesulfitobacterium ferrireducens]
MIFETNKNSASRKLYELLKEEIIQLRLKPGSNISENEISEKYNVSRTPVREAFLRLSQEGLLTIYPQKGTFVSLIDLSLVEEARFLRETLEKAVVNLACKEFSQEKVFALEMNLKYQEMYIKNHDSEKQFQADEQFHKLIFEGCDKTRIWKIIDEMNNDFKRIRLLRLATNFNWDDIYIQHSNIFNGIIHKNPELAEKAMKEHLTAVNFDKTELVKKYPEYFKEVE